MKAENLRKLWLQLRDHHARSRPSLRSIHIDRLRGLEDLTVDLHYPVTVVAGENGTGKSTILLAAACGFAPVEVPSQHAPEFLLARFTPSDEGLRDEPEECKFEVRFVTDNRAEQAFTWSLGKEGWQRSWAGAEDALTPTYRCYLRTRSGFDNPATAHRMLQNLQDHNVLADNQLPPEQIGFARTVIPHFSYDAVRHLTAADGDMLFAIRPDGAQYSEPLMAGGERVALRLGLGIAGLRNALVLIDEVEDGLHPGAQELLMISLQRLAIQRNLQFIVTTHSPVVLDAVPGIGRVFLEHATDGKTRVIPAYADVVQDVLYKRPLRAFNLLCEDDVSEAMLNGILDHLVPQQEWPRSGIQVRRDTGASEFATHARAFEKVEALENFAFVLDGDQQGGKAEKRLREVTEQPIIFLPGEGPEVWVWERLQENSERYALALGMNQRDFDAVVEEIYGAYIIASGSKTNKFKHMLIELSDNLKHSVPEICRIVAREECDQVANGIRPVVSNITVAFEDWRQSQLAMLE